ncbi:MAG: sel1 repeat family protein [Neisseriaceae bacterium]|nr:sel1 repeat family protein [Neisseriaceae bacterium]MBQ9724072.1 sel1 repeat family protein [Neisseriaceae bacterium]
MKKTLLFIALLCSLNIATAKTVAEIKEDYIRHLPEIQRAAQQGDPNAQAILGTMYKKGWGVERNDSQAYEWLEKSARQGNKMAQNNLAGLYTRDNTQNNDEQALRLFQQSAKDRNDVASNYNLGLMYENGYGTAVDLKKAEYHFSKAAARGHKRSQEALENVRRRMGK